MNGSAVYYFGPFVLDPDQRRLLRDGVAIPLTPKAFDALVLLVERRGSLVDKSEFMQALWPDTFVEDVTLARNISSIRKALGDDAESATFIETVPKSGYRFVAPVQVLESTDPATVKAPAEKRSNSRRMLIASLAAATVLAVGIGWSWRQSIAGAMTGGTPVRSLAILPFKSFGESEPVLELGLADTLISRLNRSAVVVRPISAVRTYASPQQDPLAAGTALKVDAVLDGTVQRTGTALRITATLHRVSDGSVLWSGTFDDPGGSLFATEDSISTQVAAAIVPQLTRETRARLSKRDTSNAEANREYLLGRHFWNRRSPEGFRKAVEHLERAVRLDPQFGLAFAGLADAYLLVGDQGAQHDTIARARAAATRALEIDPTLAEAHASLALVATNYDWNWAEGEQQYLKAIALNPNYAVAHAWYGEYLAFMGQFDKGVAENARAQELDPLSPFIQSDAAKIFSLSRQYNRAMAQAKRVLELDPTFTRGHFELAGAYMWLGRGADAVTEIDSAHLANDDPWVIASRATAYAAAGRKGDARALFNRLLDMSARTYLSPQILGRAAIVAGERDQAFAWLNRMCDERAPGPIALNVDPTFDPLRGDPRFDALLRRVGFVH